MTTHTAADQRLGTYTLTLDNGTQATIMAADADAAVTAVMRNRPSQSLIDVARAPERPYRVTLADGTAETVLAANDAHAYALHKRLHPETAEIITGVAEADSTPVSEIARCIDPDAARHALAAVLARLGGSDWTGSVDDWDALVDAVLPAAPRALPSIADDAPEATAFWDTVTAN